MVAVERFKLKSIYECMKRVAVVAVGGGSTVLHVSAISTH